MAFIDTSALCKLVASEQKRPYSEQNPSLDTQNCWYRVDTTKPSVVTKYAQRVPKTFQPGIVESRQISSAIGPAKSSWVMRVWPKGVDPRVPGVAGQAIDVTVFDAEGKWFVWPSVGEPERAKT